MNRILIDTLEDTPYQETWQALESLVDEGLVKNIGFSNVQGSLILDVERYARIKPSILQIELHPYLTQEPLLELAKLLGIAVTVYSSFGPQVWEVVSNLFSPTLIAELRRTRYIQINPRSS
jgi:diketogulonate reductase-like aldo/keto reductase